MPGIEDSVNKSKSVSPCKDSVLSKSKKKEGTTDSKRKIAPVHAEKHIANEHEEEEEDKLAREDHVEFECRDIEEVSKTEENDGLIEEIVKEIAEEHEKEKKEEAVLEEILEDISNEKLKIQKLEEMYKAYYKKEEDLFEDEDEDEDEQSFLQKIQYIIDLVAIIKRTATDKVNMYDKEFISKAKSSMNLLEKEYTLNQNKNMHSIKEINESFNYDMLALHEFMNYTVAKYQKKIDSLKTEIKELQNKHKNKHFYTAKIENRLLELSENLNNTKKLINTFLEKIIALEERYNKYIRLQRV